MGAREIQQLQLSPDGSHIAFLREHQERLILHTVNLLTGDLHRLGGDLREDVRECLWVGPDTLVFRLQVDELYTQGLWLTDEDLRSNKPVLRAEDRVLVIADPLPADPNSLLLRDQETFSPLFRLKLATKSLHQEVANPGRVFHWFTDATGQVRAALQATEPGSWRVLLYGEDRKWSPLELPARSHPLTCDPTGRNILIEFPDEEGRMVLQNFDTLARQFTGRRMADPVCDVVDEILKDPRTGEVVGLVSALAKPRVRWLSADYKNIQEVVQKALPNDFCLPLGATAKGEILVLAMSDVRPPTYFLFDAKSGRLALLIEESPEAGSRQLAQMRPIAFPASDGYPLHGYLTLPPAYRAGDRVAMIALAHGGPTARDRWGYDPEVQLLAALGYGVIQVNYRGSSGYGMKHELKDIIEVGRTAVDDVADGLRWVVTEGLGDRDRLVVYGASYGGYIALELAARHPDLPACVIGSAGVYDWEKQMMKERHDDPALMRWRTDVCPSVLEHAAEYRAISPIHRAASVRAPVLLLHGAQDNIVDIFQSNRMYDALKAAGRHVEIFKQADGLHSRFDARRRIAQTRATIAFLLQHVPPSRPALAKQADPGS